MSKDKTKQKVYKQKFRKAWLHDEVLEDWVMAIADDPTKAYCKICDCELKAKYQELKLHSKSKKHQKMLECYDFNGPRSKTVLFENKSFASGEESIEDHATFTPTKAKIEVDSANTMIVSCQCGTLDCNHLSGISSSSIIVRNTDSGISLLFTS